MRCDKFEIEQDGTVKLDGEPIRPTSLSLNMNAREIPKVDLYFNIIDVNTVIKGAIETRYLGLEDVPSIALISEIKDRQACGLCGSKAVDNGIMMMGPKRAPVCLLCADEIKDLRIR